ncbi:uncharacterized protein H6S33_011734 [Morchella sextelata]|uniref:uncharacterized protein n=1 Tax=Morchella sextelata TaxID=1174677 RepID=UPI001D0447DD|nr:uncharacterized protein H6S33_011734 [Morchella sextelata]KAH0610207.1 hypothetical protein H6S33_011734 [Morchella sextelata]
MAPPSPDLTLYLVTDSSLLPPGTTLPEHVRASIKGGVTIVQLREKKLSTAAFISLGKQVHAVTKELGVPLLINDRVDVALAVGCEGVHVGWDDMDCQTARKILGPDAIIGLSVSNKEQLAKALEAGPTYLGVGPVYATPTKPDHNTPLGLDGLQQLLQHIPADLPCCAIGGINAQNAGTVMNTSPVRSLEGLAIVSAIMASPEPTGTCKSLKSLIVLSIVYEEPKKVDLTSDLLQMLRKFRENGPPLVHHITNNVSKTLHANVTLAIGASPIMSENESEFQDLARLGSSVSLVLNMGTFLGEEATKNLFINAIKAHKDCGNFIVFDPVGAGATESRRNFAKIIKKAGTTNGSMVIKGNEGEILTLAGENVSMRGVDGAGAKSGRERERELAAIISKLSRDSKGSIIVMTGPTDIISDGVSTFLLRNGDPIQTMVTGIGCVLSSVIAAILWSSKGSHEALLAAVAAVSFFNLSAELAANTEPKLAGPASWAVRFVDMLSKEPTEDFVRQFRIEEIKV